MMQDVFDYIDNHVEDYISLLAFLCNHETLAIERRGIEEGAKRVASLIQKIGEEPQIISFQDTMYIITRIDRGHDQTLGFYNHFDTYPVGPLSAWNTPPFTLSREGDYLFARGACDNKGNIAARLSAIEAYKTIRGKLPINILLLQDAEEEIGSPSLGLFVREHADILRTDGWIWEAGSKDANERLEIFLGAHGILYVNLEVETAAEDLHGSYAGTFPNAVWRLVWALNALVDENGHCLIPGFYEPVEDASDHVRNLLHELPIDLEQLRNQLQIKQRRQDLNRDRFNILTTQYIAPYVSVIGIGGGHQGDGVGVILPHRAQARVGFFLVPNQDPEYIMGLLRNYLDGLGFDDVEIQVEITMPPSRTEPTAGLAQYLVSSANAVYDRQPAVYPSMRGISPMGFITKQFAVPVIGTGVGHVNSRIHQPNENIRIKDFVENIKLIAMLIDLVAGLGRESSQSGSY